MLTFVNVLGWHVSECIGILRRLRISANHDKAPARKARSRIAHYFDVEKCRGELRNCGRTANHAERTYTCGFCDDCAIKESPAANAQNATAAAFRRYYADLHSFTLSEPKAEYYLRL